MRGKALIIPLLALLLSSSVLMTAAASAMLQVSVSGYVNPQANNTVVKKLSIRLNVTSGGSANASKTTWLMISKGETVVLTVNDSDAKALANYSISVGAREGNDFMWFGKNVLNPLHKTASFTASYSGNYTITFEVTVWGGNVTKSTPYELGITITAGAS